MTTKEFNVYSSFSDDIQILSVSTKFVEGTNNIGASTVAFINKWALAMDIDDALELNRFAAYCKSNAATFCISDIVTINTFKVYEHYTLKACATGQGLG